MVSQSSRPGAPSRDRLVAAAAAEFAARGFDGAKVDRIARRARVNKAMVYYHFHNKAALYRAILTDVFRALAAAVADVRVTPGRPDARIRRFIRAIAAETAARPHFPPIWLREMAEGGRHLDRAIVGEMARVLQTLAGILEEGRASGVFGDAHPFVTQMGIVGPLLLFAASAPVRERFRDVVPIPIAAISREELIAYVETATLAALEAKPSGHTISSSASSRSRRRRS